LIWPSVYWSRKATELQPSATKLSSRYDLVGLAFYQVRVGYKIEWPTQTGWEAISKAVDIVWYIWAVVSVPLNLESIWAYSSSPFYISLGWHCSNSSYRNKFTEKSRSSLRFVSDIPFYRCWKVATSLSLIYGIARMSFYTLQFCIDIWQIGPGVLDTGSTLHVLTTCYMYSV
jgi:hypothetical protein